MLPTLFDVELGGRSFAIDTHGLLIMLGAIAGLLLSLRLGRDLGIARAALRELALELMLVGAIGARLFYLVFHASDYLTACSSDGSWLSTFARCAPPLWLWQSGFSFPGGMLVAVVWLGVRTRGRATLAIADAFTPGLALSHVFAKAGCLLGGCCYGGVTASAWGLRYGADSVAFQQMLDAHRLTLGADRTPPLAPVQLYEALADALTCGLLVLLLRARVRRGTCLAVYVITQLGIRLGFAWLRVATV